MTMPPYQPSYDSDEAGAIAGAAAVTPASELEHEPDEGEDSNVCPDCGRTFVNKHALAVHRGRTHKPRPNGRPAIRTPAASGRAAPPRRSGPPKVARSDAGDQLRELVALLDRLAEARDEVARLEHDAAERQAELAKVWAR